MAAHTPYYRRDLALVHHRGFGFHARACAPGILALLEPVRSREGIVLELGCGSGLLTRELTAAGHRVIATDASPAMLNLARCPRPMPWSRSATCSTTCPMNPPSTRRSPRSPERYGPAACSPSTSATLP